MKNLLDIFLISAFNICIRIKNGTKVLVTSLLVYFAALLSLVAQKKKKNSCWEISDLQTIDEDARIRGASSVFGAWGSCNFIYCRFV